ncbi:MAG TPA: protein kinase [Verrucomicrobiae bacterium]|nr:protein kinase [Verrucomicrobiae bacterium]
MSETFDSRLDSPRCRTCGGSLDGSRFEGLCPACAWRALSEPAPEENLEGVIQSTTKEKEIEGDPGLLRPLFKLPGHVVLEELARGGMGIVYRARQVDPYREVAVKMLLPHQLGSPEMAARFRLEVRTLTGLDHPAILPVYQTGEQDGLPYFTMKLARGGTLARRRADYTGSWRAIAELIAVLAEAVQFAHERGVLHRDLKPGNILFDENGRAYVSDFGLAKMASSDSELTRTMDFLGTPHYVAPEVAAQSARQATIASDIYSLGAVFYELLCGHPPFQAESVAALLKKIAEEEAAIRSEFQRVPRDLGVICLKCLAKQPAGRYASARELAADLQCWLNGRPIQARPISVFEQAGRWARRNPVVAGLAAALALALAGGGFILWKTERVERTALRTTRQAETRAQENLREALLAQAQALGAAAAAGQRWQALAALEKAARIRPALELRNEAAAALARPDLREIARFPAFFGDAGSPAVFTSNLESYASAELSGGFSLRSASDQKILAAFPGALRQPARWFVLSPDERQVGALLNDYSLGVWDIGSDRPKLRWPGSLTHPPVIAFNPNGSLLAGSVPGHNLFIQQEPEGERLFLESKHGRAVYARFDPSGQRLAVVRDPEGVELWSLGSSLNRSASGDAGSRNQVAGQLLWFQPIRKAVPWLAWSPDGSELAVAADDTRGVRLLSSADGQTELVYSRHLLYPRQFEFDSRGTKVASLGQDWSLRLWDSRTGQDLVTSVGRHRVMRFSADGRRLATAPNDHELAILELAPDQVFREFTSSPSDLAPNRLAHSPDGRWLLVCYPQIRLYDTEAGTEAAVLEGLPLALNKQAMFGSSSSEILYSVQGRGTFSRAFRHDARPSPAVELDQEQLLAANDPGLVCGQVQSGQSWVRYVPGALELWVNHDPRQCRKLLGLPPALPFDAFAVSPNGRWAAIPLSDGVGIWDFSTGQVLTNLVARNPGRAWFSPDGKWLVASVEQGYATWQTESWRPGAAWVAHLDSGDPGEVSFSDDSRFLVARQERHVFRLFSFPECRELVTLKPPLVVPIRSACLNGDGSRLWLLAAGYRVFEWNLTELRKELVKLGLDWQTGPS